MQISLAAAAEQYFGGFVTDRTVIPNYVYHCNVRKPSYVLSENDIELFLELSDNKSRTK